MYVGCVTVEGDIFTNMGYADVGVRITIRTDYKDWFIEEKKSVSELVRV